MNALERLLGTTTSTREYFTNGMRLRRIVVPGAAIYQQEQLFAHIDEEVAGRLRRPLTQTQRRTGYALSILAESAKTSAYWVVLQDLAR